MAMAYTSGCLVSSLLEVVRVRSYWMPTLVLHSNREGMSRAADSEISMV